MEKSTKQIKLGAIISYLALTLNIAATLLYMPWMVSVIGESNYAMYTLANSFINIFVIDFGLSSAVSKFIAQYRAEGNREKEIQFISTVIKVYIVLDIAILTILTVQELPVLPVIFLLHQIFLHLCLTVPDLSFQI